MCYSIYLSTDSPQDLAAEVFAHLQFGMPAPDPAHEELLPLFAHPRRWYLSRREYGGCSCHFRHSMDEATFEPPQDWFPEDADDIAASREAYRAFRKIVSDGYGLDLISVWDMETAEVKKLVVPLSSMGEDSFRFFSGYRFDFRP